MAHSARARRPAHERFKKPSGSVCSSGAFLSLAPLNHRVPAHPVRVLAASNSKKTQFRHAKRVELARERTGCGTTLIRSITSADLAFCADVPRVPPDAYNLMHVCAHARTCGVCRYRWYSRYIHSFSLQKPQKTGRERGLECVPEENPSRYAAKPGVLRNEP